MWCGEYSWEANCAANAQTNGIDYRNAISAFHVPGSKLAKGVILDQSVGRVAHPSDSLVPQMLPTPGSNGVVKSYVLPGDKTGVVSPIFIVTRRISFAHRHR